MGLQAFLAQLIDERVPDSRAAQLMLLSGVSGTLQLTSGTSLGVIASPAALRERHMHKHSHVLGRQRHERVQRRRQTHE
jgi:hypothetical protein